MHRLTICVALSMAIAAASFANPDLPRSHRDKLRYSSVRGLPFVDKVSAGDVRLGILEDEFLLGSLKAFAAKQPRFIRDMVGIREDGSYDVRMFSLAENGREYQAKTEVVAPKFPLFESQFAYALGGLSAKAASENRVALWPAIIEKAFAQHVGGYFGLNLGGSTIAAFGMLTGHQPLAYDRLTSMRVENIRSLMLGGMPVLAEGKDNRVYLVEDLNAERIILTYAFDPAYRTNIPLTDFSRLFEVIVAARMGE